MSINQTIASVVRKTVPQPVRRLVPLPIRRSIALRMNVTHYDILGEHVSFREEGFVAAPTPAFLLARHNHEAAAIGDYLGGATFQNALELGCGYGRLSPAISSHARALTSIDVNPDALEMARQCYPDLDFRQAAGNTLPFAGGAFDLIVSWTVLQHVPPAQFAQVASEICRVLALDGTLLLCEGTVSVERPVTPETLTWNRTLDSYRRAFEPMTLERDGLIDVLETIPGLGTPGRIMLFRGRERGHPLNVGSDRP